MPTPPPPEWYDPDRDRLVDPPQLAPYRPVDRAELTARKRLLGVVATLTLACMGARILLGQGMFKASALYVGIPALMAVGLVVSKPKDRLATTTALRGSGLALLLAGIVLPEGFICLLMAAPVVLGVAVVVGGTVDARRRRGGGERMALLVVTIPLLIASFEGVAGSPFDDRGSVTSTRVVAASPAQVEAALAAAPRFGTTEVPRFLTWGFNRAAGSTGTGLAVGDERTIHFTGGDDHAHPLAIRGNDAAHDHATMRLRITGSQPGRVVFTVLQDDTMSSKWTELHRTIVSWDTTATTATTVSWTVEYRRLLSPSVYFGPLQRYALTQAADYLLDATVGPPAP